MRIISPSKMNLECRTIGCWTIIAKGIQTISSTKSNKSSKSIIKGKNSINNWRWVRAGQITGLRKKMSHQNQVWRKRMSKVNSYLKMTRLFKRHLMNSKSKLLCLKTYNMLFHSWPLNHTSTRILYLSNVMTCPAFTRQWETVYRQSTSHLNLLRLASTNSERKRNTTGSNTRS
jgi:hypothetical protein